MTDANILEILKYAGFALTAATALWGLTQKTTYDDNEGRKRLTPAGYLAALLFVGSALVGATAFGFETLAKDADRKAAADAKRTAQLDQAQRDTAALQAELRRRAEAAELRAAAADQRSLTLQTEAEQRRRDLEIAANVNRGASANLRQARVTLGQVQRLLNPLGEIQVTVTFQVDASSIDSPSLQRLRVLAAEAQRDRNVYDTARVSWGPRGARPFPIRTVSVDRESPYFPSADDPLTKVIPGLVNFDITLNGSQAARENEESIRIGTYPFSWDLSFSALSPTIEQIGLVLPDKVVFTVAASIPALDVNGTGRIASVTDLDNANLIVTWSPSGFSSELPSYDIAIESARLQFGSRIFDFEGRAFRKVDAGAADRKHFIIARMGRPIF